MLDGLIKEEGVFVVAGDQAANATSASLQRRPSTPDVRNGRTQNGKVEDKKGRGNEGKN